jgi:hypothetical protein
MIRSSSHPTLSSAVRSGSKHVPMAKSVSTTRLDCLYYQIHHSSDVVADMVLEFQIESIARVPVFAAGVCTAAVHEMPLDLMSPYAFVGEAALSDESERAMASCMAVSPENTVIAKDVALSPRTTTMMLRRRKKRRSHQSPEGRYGE